MRLRFSRLRLWSILTVVGLAVVDQVVKEASLRLELESLVTNQGIAFGFWPTKGWVVVILGVLVFLTLKASNSLPWSLVIAGGTSNLVDRLVRGAVVDMISVPFIPTFNLADLFIVVGVGWLILVQLVHGESDSDL